MSHVREVFPTLENAETQIGEVLHLIRLGDRLLKDDLLTQKNGQIAFSFQDEDGRVTMPTLNEEGALKVSLDFGTTKRAKGKNTTGIKATYDGAGEINNHLVIAELGLQADYTYTKLSAIGSCFRNTEFRVQLVNDEGGGSETITDLGEFLTSAGAPNGEFKHVIDEFKTTGFTGVIKLRLVAANLERASRISGSIACNEITQNVPNP